MRGTLDLLILRSLSGGPRHGYAISGWIATATSDTLTIEEGTLYPALHRLERRRWVKGKWGLSSNKRHAKFYELSENGRKHLAAELENWKEYSRAVQAALAAEVGHSR